MVPNRDTKHGSRPREWPGERPSPLPMLLLKTRRQPREHGPNPKPYHPFLVGPLFILHIMQGSFIRSLLPLPYSICLHVCAYSQWQSVCLGAADSHIPDPRRDLEPDYIYTLQVYIGNRLDTIHIGDSTIQLLAGTQSIIDYSYSSDPNGPLAYGYTRLITLSYLSPQTLGSLAGQPLEIILGDLTGQTWFDEVSLDAVPIPAAVWLLGSGLLGMAVRRYRKK